MGRLAFALVRWTDHAMAIRTSDQLLVAYEPHLIPRPLQPGDSGSHGFVQRSMQLRAQKRGELRIIELQRSLPEITHFRHFVRKRIHRCRRPHQ